MLVGFGYADPLTWWNGLRLASVTPTLRGKNVRCTKKTNVDVWVWASVCTLAAPVSGCPRNPPLDAWGCHRTRNSYSVSFRVSRNVCPLEVRVFLTFEPLVLISLRVLEKGGWGMLELAGARIRIWNKSETGDHLWSVAQPHFRHVCFEKQRKKWASLFLTFLTFM